MPYPYLTVRTVPSVRVRTRAVPEFFQLTGRTVNGTVHTRHDRQKYGRHGRQDGWTGINSLRILPGPESAETQSSLFHLALLPPDLHISTCDRGSTLVTEEAQSVEWHPSLYWGHRIPLWEQNSFFQYVAICHSFSSHFVLSCPPALSSPRSPSQTLKTVASSDHQKPGRRQTVTLANLAMPPLDRSISCWDAPARSGPISCIIFVRSLLLFSL